ncbi:MAG TPA: hypothetical protein VIR63_02730 [Pontiella sp.]
MEDLIPFLIFIVIAFGDGIKRLIEKKSRESRPTAPAQEEPQNKPSTLEDFFKSLSEQINPKPTELSEWPEDRERPNYAQEMKEYEMAQSRSFTEDDFTETTSPVPAVTDLIEMEIKAHTEVAQKVAMQAALKSVPNAFANIKGARFPTMPKLNPGDGKIRFSLKEKADLKQAIIANLVFSQPRAYDTSFDNSTMK